MVGSAASPILRQGQFPFRIRLLVWATRAIHVIAETTAKGEKHDIDY
jgi:hypothetical protein